MRRASLVGLIVLVILAACSRPLAFATETPAAKGTGRFETRPDDTPTPTPIWNPGRVPADQVVHLAWFYKPPSAGDLVSLQQHFDIFILTKNDETERDQLRALGVTAPMLQYLRIDAIHDPGSCDETPRQNQAANQPGDFCRLSQDHPDWFLRNKAGDLIRNDEDYIWMDPANPGWRLFFLERARQSQEQLAWDGVFLDNVEASLAKLERLGAPPAAYADDAAYQAAVEGFLSYLYGNYFRPSRRPLLANIISIRDENVWPRYLQYLDGAMMERFAVGWDDYLAPEEWARDVSRAEIAQQLGKQVILVAQGAQNDLSRQQFAFATYLLVSGGRASFRYANDAAYREMWLYPNYDLALGSPRGPRYLDGGGWRRDFDNGRVTVDPAAHTATIMTSP